MKIYTRLKNEKKSIKLACYEMLRKFIQFRNELIYLKLFLVYLNYLVLIRMIALRKGEPSLEVLQYQIKLMAESEQAPDSRRFPKISLIFWAPFRNRIRY